MLLTPVFYKICRSIVSSSGTSMMEILNYPQLLQTFVAHFVLVYY